ncbi:hypothetical protein L3V83_09415 [Thiotrichales bacterium 19X7-9]|nr:hypothetical protein [Thiotrichales bacterium 19X7-9]
MKEYIGLKSWLGSKFIEQVLTRRLAYKQNTIVTVPSLDDASTIQFALARHNDLLGRLHHISELSSDSGYRTVGQPNGKDWDEYKYFIIPLNTGAMHNEAIILCPGTNKAIFIDPQGSSIPNNRREELASLGFTNILSTKRVQKDHYRCGDYTIELVTQILNENQPENINHESLNVIANRIANYNNQQLDQNRASYVQDYLASLVINNAHLQNTQLVVSNSLYNLIDNTFYSSAYLSSEADDQVALHDANARQRESSVYHNYLRRSNLSKNVYKSDINQNQFKKKHIDDKKSQKNLSTPNKDNLPKIKKSLKETLQLQQSILQLEHQMKLFDKELILLSKLKEKELLEGSDIKNLVKRDINIQSINAQVAELKKHLDLLQDELMARKIEIADVISQAIDEPPIDSLTNTHKSIQQFLAFENMIGMVEYSEKQKQINGQTAPLYDSAKKYQKRYLEVQEAKVNVSLKEAELSKLDKINLSKQEVVKHWKILHQVVQQAKSEYYKHLTHKNTENIAKVDEKFNQFIKFGDTFGDGIEVENLTYEGLANSLFACYTEMKTREPSLGPFRKMSDSRRYLLNNLKLVGILDSDFKNKKTLLLKIQKIDFSSTNKEVLQQLFPVKNNDVENFLDNFSKQFLLDRLKKVYSKTTLKEARLQLVSVEQSLNQCLLKHESNFKKIDAFIAKCNQLELVKKERQYTQQEDRLNKLLLINEKLTKDFKKEEAIIHKDPKTYISNRLDQLQQNINECKIKLDKLAIKKFNELDEKVIHPDKGTSLSDKVNHIIKEMACYDKLAYSYINVQSKSLTSEQKMIFGSMLDDISDIYDHGLRKKLNAIQRDLKNKELECKKLIENENRQPGILHQSIIELNDYLSMTFELMNESKRKITEYVIWLLNNSDDVVELPEEINSLDFSGFDLRGVDLSRIQDHKGNDFDFSRSIFDQTVLGSISYLELRDRLQNFKKSFVDNKATIEDLHQKLLQLVALDDSKFKNDNYDNEQLKKMKQSNLDVIQKLWQTSFPNFPIYHQRDNLVQIQKYLKIIQQALGKQNGLKTKFPLDMGCIDFSQAEFVGEIKNVSLENSNIPKDLRGIDLSGAIISNLDLDSHIIDKTTKLNNVTFNNVKFNNCQITDVCFENCQFDYCILEGEELNLEGSEFKGCKFHSCKFGNGLEYNKKEKRDGVKVQAAFNQCQFRGITELSSACDISLSKFNSVYFENLFLGYDCRLPESRSSSVLRIKKLNNGVNSNRVNIEGTILADKSTQYIGITADTFIKQFNNLVEDLTNNKMKMSQIRKDAYQWFNCNIKKISGHREYTKILNALEAWKIGNIKDSASNKTNHMWRLFNYQSRNLFTFGKIKSSKSGRLMIEIVQNKLKKIETDHEISTYGSQLPNEYQFLRKAFNQLLGDKKLSSYKNLNINNETIDVIEKIRQGKKVFSADFLSKYANAAKKFQSTKKDQTISQMKKFVTEMSKNKNFDNSVDVLVQLLVKNPQMINDVVDQWRPLELVQAMYTLRFYNQDLVNHLESTNHYHNLQNQVKFVSSAYDTLLKTAICNTLEQLRNDKELLVFFIEMIKDFPLSKHPFLDLDEIEKFMNGKEANIFKNPKISVATRMDLINEMLKLFDTSYQFFTGKHQQQAQKISNIFLKKFRLENKDFQKRLLSDAKERFSGNFDKMVNSFLKQEASIGEANHPHIDWPKDTSKLYYAKNSCCKLQEALKGYLNEKVQAYQIDQYVKKVIAIAVGIYNSQVNNKSQVNKRFKNIAQITPKNAIRNTWFPKGKHRLFKLEDLNEIMKYVSNSRGAFDKFFAKADFACEAFNEALQTVDELSDNIFKKLSDGGQIIVTYDGKLPQRVSVSSGLLQHTHNVTKFRKAPKIMFDSQPEKEVSNNNELLSQSV